MAKQKDNKQEADAAVAAPAEVKANVPKAAPKAPKARAAFGVTLTAKGRPYFAAQVIKKFGLDAGVTAEMVAAVDKLMGVPNADESKFWLRNIHQALRGLRDLAGEANK